MRRLRLVLLAVGIAATSLALASCGGSSDEVEAARQRST